MVNITYDHTPPKPELIQLFYPTGDITENKPTFEWNPVTDTPAGLLYYTIEVSNVSNFEYILSEYSKNVTTNTFKPDKSFGDGTYYWRIRAVDKAWNFGSWNSTSFNVSTGAPLIEKFYINYEGAEYTNTTNVTLFIVSPDAGWMNFSNDGNNWTGWLPFQSSYSWDLIQYGGNVSDGLKKVYIACVKTIGGNNSTDATEITLDMTPPEILYNYPSKGGETVWYKDDLGNVIDIDFGWVAFSPLYYAQYRINDGDWSDIFNENRYDYTLNWNVTWSVLNQGENQVSIRVADKAGNVLTHNYVPGISGFLFKKDTVAPSVPNIITPENNTIVECTEAEFSWVSVDDPSPGSGFDKYQIEIYDVDFNLKYKFEVEVNYTSENLTDGKYYWRIRALDNAGNLADWSENFTFSVSTGGPKNLEFKINGGAEETSTEQVWLTIYAENADRIRFSNDASENWSGWMDYTIILPWNLSFVPEYTSENRTVYLECLNSKTGKSAIKFASILVNKNPPLVKIFARALDYQ
jgi:hypothetical protein